MTITILFNWKSGATLKATLQRPTGNFWNDTSNAGGPAWQTAPSFANKTIALTENAGDYVGLYNGANSNTTGAETIIVYIHDAGDSNRVVGVLMIVTDSSGNEVFNNNVDVAKIVGVDATGLSKSVKAIGYGTVGVGSNTTSVVTSALIPVGTSSNQLKDRVIIFDIDTTTAGLRGAVGYISSATISATPTLSLANTLPATPANTDKFTVL